MGVPFRPLAGFHFLPRHGVPADLPRIGGPFLLGSRGMAAISVGSQKNERISIEENGGGELPKSTARGPRNGIGPPKYSMTYGLTRNDRSGTVPPYGVRMMPGRLILRDPSPTGRRQQGDAQRQDPQTVQLRNRQPCSQLTHFIGPEKLDLKSRQGIQQAPEAEDHPS